MKIRAITVGVPFNLLENNFDLNPIQSLKEELNKNDIEVQTIRLCTPPFTNTTNFTKNAYFKNPDKILTILESFLAQGLLDYYSFLPGLCDQTTPLTDIQKKIISLIPDFLKKHKRMMTSIQISSLSRGINFEVIPKCSNIIIELAKIDPFLNLQFAATFNVPPNTPFFPSAYHIGETPKISIALEAADEIVEIMREYSKNLHSLSWIRTKIQDRFSQIYDNIRSILEPFCKNNGIIFEGVDFSPAQFPTKDKSIGTAIEGFGFGEFGQLGTVFAIGFLTSAIQGINRPKIGFSGFMQPLLEDYTIAKRNNEGKIDITKLLLNSTVCGLGLDCIPLPGNVNEQTLSLLMLDIAMISSRLNKPLTARLMPIPGKKEGEQTEFDFKYFTNSKICKLNPSSLNKLGDFLHQNFGFQPQ